MLWLAAQPGISPVVTRPCLHMQQATQLPSQLPGRAALPTCATMSSIRRCSYQMPCRRSRRAGAVSYQVSHAAARLAPGAQATVQRAETNDPPRAWLLALASYWAL